MIKFVLLGLLLTAAGRADDSTGVRNHRQKKFLFYDESGRMVNIFANPFLQNFFLNAGNLPLFWNFLNPFFNYLRPISISGTSACFMIPVSEQVIQDIAHDPVYENNLVLPQKQPVIEPNPLCAGKKGAFPSPRSCGSFLNCWEGWAFEQQCPEGLMFSNEGFCDYSDNVDCKKRFKPLMPNQCSQDFQTFRNKANCNEFFVCVGRQPVKFQCPANLAYNEILGICDYRDKVNCAPLLGDAPSLPPPIPPASIAPSPPAIPPAPIAPSPPAIPPAPSPISPVPSDSFPIAPVPSEPFPIAPVPSAPSSKPALVPAFYPTEPPSVAVQTEPPQIQTLPPASLASSKPYISSDFIFSNSIFQQDSLLAAYKAMSREDAIKKLQATLLKK